MDAQQIDRRLAQIKPFGSDANNCNKIELNNYVQIGNMRIYAIADSTMTRAAEMMRTGLDTTTFILARQQTAGIGSGNHKWVSPDGNVFLTFIAKIGASGFAQEEELKAACATAEIAQEALPVSDRDKVTVKWPNDIRIDFKGEAAKIGGCLAPPGFDFPQYIGKERWVTVGIGFNAAVAPLLPDRKTTCLADHGVTMSIGAFVEKFVQRYAEIDAQHKASSFNTVLKRVGFLAEDGTLPLTRKKDNELVRGHYAGFWASQRYGKDEACILLRDKGSTLTPHPVHDYAIVSAPGRPGPFVAQNTNSDARQS